MADISQLLGQPGGMGRAAAVAPVRGGDVRRVRDPDEVAVAVAVTPATEPGFARQTHPLNVIGSSGRP